MAKCSRVTMIHSFFVAGCHWIQRQLIWKQYLHIQNIYKIIIQYPSPGSLDRDPGSPGSQDPGRNPKSGRRINGKTNNKTQYH